MLYHPYYLTLSLLIAIEFFIVSFFNLKNTEKKARFPLRLILPLSLIVIIIFVSPLITGLFNENIQEYLHLRIYLYFDVVFLLSVPFLFKKELPFAFFNILLCMITSFLSDKISYFVVYSIQSFYPNISIHLSLLFQGLFFIPSFLLIYYFFTQRYKDKIENRAPFPILFFAISFNVISIIINSVQLYLYKNNTGYTLMMNLFALFYVMIIIFLFYAVLNQREQEQEMAIINKLWDDDRKHYEMQKESMEMINIKVHDLKHQIADIKEAGSLTDKMVSQLEESTDIYQSIVHTENNVLDVILSSVSLRCQKANIQLTCMANGKAVDFIDDVDLYSLIGNMMDNAIEYETKIEEPSLRFLSLTIKEKNNVIKIHAENYYDGEDRTIESLSTTKMDKKNHGYGTKSMEKIVEKYHGIINFSIKDRMFQVDCMFNRNEAKES